MDLTLSLTILCLSAVIALPQGPMEEFAVPYHTTNSYIFAQLKNMYNYVFNKPESVHQDGYTKVYVMGKYMFYTYTHEFTAGDGWTDNSGMAITEDPVIRTHLGPEAAQKQRADVYKNMKRQHELEKEAKIQMAAKEKADRENSLGRRIVRTVLRNIPIVKLFV